MKVRAILSENILIVIYFLNIYIVSKFQKFQEDIQFKNRLVTLVRKPVSPSRKQLKLPVSFLLLLHCIACENLVPQQGIKPTCPKLEGQSLNHSPTGKSLKLSMS